MYTQITVEFKLDHIRIYQFLIDKKLSPSEILVIGAWQSCWALSCSTSEVPKRPSIKDLQKATGLSFSAVLKVSAKHSKGFMSREPKEKQSFHQLPIAISEKKYKPTKLSATLKIYIAVILYYEKLKKASCIASNKELSERLKTSEISVIRNLKKLSKLGYISIDRSSRPRKIATTDKVEIAGGRWWLTKQ